jgi:hypothetical protein
MPKEKELGRPRLISITGNISHLTCTPKTVKGKAVPVLNYAMKAYRAVDV